MIRLTNLLSASQGLLDVAKDAQTKGDIEKLLRSIESQIRILNKIQGIINEMLRQKLSFDSFVATLPEVDRTCWIIME